VQGSEKLRMSLLGTAARSDDSDPVRGRSRYTTVRSSIANVTPDHWLSVSAENSSS